MTDFAVRGHSVGPDPPAPQRDLPTNAGTPRPTANSLRQNIRNERRFNGMVRTNVKVRECFGGNDGYLYVHFFPDGAHRPRRGPATPARVFSLLDCRCGLPGHEKTLALALPAPAGRYARATPESESGRSNSLFARRILLNDKIGPRYRSITRSTAVRWCRTPNTSKCSARAGQDTICENES